MALTLNNWQIGLPAFGILSAIFFSPALARWVILGEILLSLGLVFLESSSPLTSGGTFAVFASAIVLIAVFANKPSSTKAQIFCLAGSQLCLAILFTSPDSQTFMVSAVTYSFLLFLLAALEASDAFSEVSALALLGGFLLVLSSFLAPASAAFLALASAAFLGPAAPASPGLRKLLKGKNLPAKILAVGAGPLVSYWVVKRCPIDPAFASGWPVVLVGLSHLFGAWLAWESRRWSDWLAAATSTTVSFSILGLLADPSFNAGPVGGAALYASILVFVFDWVERQIPEGSLGDSGTLRTVPFASVLITLSFIGLLGFPRALALPTSGVWVLVSIALTWACLAVSGLKLLLPLFLSSPSELTPPKDVGVVPFVICLAVCAAALTVQCL